MLGLSLVAIPRGRWSWWHSQSVLEGDGGSHWCSSRGYLGPTESAAAGDVKGLCGGGGGGWKSEQVRATNRRHDGSPHNASRSLLQPSPDTVSRLRCSCCCALRCLGASRATHLVHTRLNFRAERPFRYSTCCCWRMRFVIQYFGVDARTWPSQIQPDPFQKAPPISHRRYLITPPDPQRLK